MFRAILVEDERSILALHAQMLKEHGGFVLAGQYSVALDALAEIPRLQADVLFLDVEMPGMTGMKLAISLREQGINTPIVFVTAHREYAVDAFFVQALDYLLKPVAPEDLDRIYLRLQNVYNYSNRIHDASGKQPIQVRLFGSPMVRSSSGVLVKWPTRLTEELFYYLYLHQGHAVSKWTLLDTLWPELEMDRALANLNNTIYRLRQLFVDMQMAIRIERIGDGYQLMVDDSVMCDCRRLENIISGSKEADLVGLRRAGLLADGRILDSKGYLWALPFQERYYQLWQKFVAMDIE